MDKDIDLTALFAEAAEQEPAPSPALLARILHDAARLQPLAPPLVSPTPQPRPRGWLAGWAEVLGGGRALAGLSFAGMTGLFLGAAEPAMLSSVTTLILGSTTVEQIDLLPDTGSLWTED